MPPRRASILCARHAEWDLEVLEVRAGEHPKYLGDSHVGALATGDRRSSAAHALHFDSCKGGSPAVTHLLGAARFAVASQTFATGKVLATSCRRVAHQRDPERLSPANDPIQAWPGPRDGRKFGEFFGLSPEPAILPIS